MRKSIVDKLAEIDPNLAAWAKTLRDEGYSEETIVARLREAVEALGRE